MLYKQWTKLIENQNDTTIKEFWDEYSAGETKIYTDILENKKNIFAGKVKELAEKYEVREVIFMGFLDGISTSLNSTIDLESISSESEISLDINFANLFKNMIKADADYLYSIEAWKDIFSEEEQKELYDEYRRSRTVVKDSKVGRNEPCPCKSGKKYKHCCGK